MLSRNIPRRLKSPGTLFERIDINHGCLLTGTSVKGIRTRAGRRISSSQSQKSTSSTKVSHDTHAYGNAAQSIYPLHGVHDVFTSKNRPSSSSDSSSMPVKYRTRTGRSEEESAEYSQSTNRMDPVPPKYPGFMKSGDNFCSNRTERRSWNSGPKDLPKARGAAVTNLQSSQKPPYSSRPPAVLQKFQPPSETKAMTPKKGSQPNSLGTDFTPTQTNFRVTRKDGEINEMREGVRREVEGYIQRRFGRSYTVEFFGSLRYNVSHRTSDLDMVILDKTRPRGYEEADSIEKNVLIYNVRRLAGILRQWGFVDVESRPWASVPIVKFRDPRTNLECDLNVNDRLGIANSDMINEYLKCDPHIRPLLFEIKEWAKPLGLNSPSGGKGISPSFSSYAFALMTIAFFQDKHHLINLQQGLPDVPSLPSDGLPGVPPNRKLEGMDFIKFTKKPCRGWDTRYNKVNRSNINRIEWNPAKMTDYAYEWASYWEKFPFATHAIDIRAGGVVERRDDLASPICVMDPFITTKNVTRSVSNAVASRFIDECHRATSEHDNRRPKKSSATQRN